MQPQVDVLRSVSGHAVIVGHIFWSHAPHINRKSVFIGISFTEGKRISKKQQELLSCFPVFHRSVPSAVIVDGVGSAENNLLRWRHSSGDYLNSRIQLV